MENQAMEDNSPLQQQQQQKQEQPQKQHFRRQQYRQQQQQPEHPFNETDETDLTIIVNTTKPASTTEEEKNNTDVILQLYAHKSILSFYSPKFRDMLQEIAGDKQHNESMITITMIDGQNGNDVIEFFKFFYPEYSHLIEIDLGKIESLSTDSNDLHSTTTFNHNIT